MSSKLIGLIGPSREDVQLYVVKFPALDSNSC